MSAQESTKRKSPKSTPESPRQNNVELVNDFWAAVDDALFPQRVIAAVRGCSESLCERERWAGTGPPFIKIGRLVRYRKRESVRWLNRHPTFTSTSEYQQPLETA